jgi:anti-anti-sigma regulatory factor
VLAGRGVARVLHARVEESIGERGSVVVDFEGVESMSPSFADELFAKLSVRPDDERITFEHLNDDLQALARFVIEGRTGSSS